MSPEAPNLTLHFILVLSVVFWGHAHGVLFFLRKAASSDKLVGSGLLLVSVSIFVYYTLWVIVLVRIVDLLRTQHTCHDLCEEGRTPPVVSRLIATQRRNSADGISPRFRAAHRSTAMTLVVTWLHVVRCFALSRNEHTVAVSCCPDFTEVLLVHGVQ